MPPPVHTPIIAPSGGQTGVSHTPIVNLGDGQTGIVPHTRGSGGGPLATNPYYWGIIDQTTQPWDMPYRDPVITPVAVDALLSVAFGQVRVGGLMLYVEGLGGASMTYGRGVIAWCEGEIESIDAIWGNTAPFNARSDSIVTLALNELTGVPGGDTNPWDVIHGNIFGKPQPGLANVAYTYWTIETVIYWYRWWNYLPGAFTDGPNTNSSMDTVPWAADVHGLKLYDPRLDSLHYSLQGGSGSQDYANPATWTYSNNPILICRYLLVRYGHLINGVDIDDANIAAMAQACDDMGFTCNVVFTAKTTVGVAISIVLQTCNGMPITVGGRAGFYLDIPNTADAVGSFSEDDGDIYGLKYEWLSARDRYTQVAVSFNNKDVNYKADQTPFFGDPATFSSEPVTLVSSVNVTTDTLTMGSSPGWIAGDTVLFFQNGGGAIPGLSDGATYFVKTISGADVTLAASTGGTTINLTGSPSVTPPQYLQRIGAAYPPTMVAKPLVVNSPGINTLAAAIILRDYSYKASAITFRISGTMNGRGILLQEGQKIHLVTKKGIDADFLLLQIPGDAQGFFTFVAKPYSSGTYTSAPISQPPPIVTTPPIDPATPGGDITVTDATTTRRVMASSASNITVYDLYQLVKYTLPTTGTTLKELRVRGFAGTGALTKTWADMVASEVVIPLAGNEPPPDASHSMLSMPGVIETVRTLTFAGDGQLITTVDVVGPTRIIIKTGTMADALSTGVTVDVASTTNTTTNPRTDIPLWKWVKSTTAANGSTKTFAVPTAWCPGTLLVIADGQPLVDTGFSPADGADYSTSGLNVTIVSGRAAPSSYVAFFYQESVA